MTPLLSNQMNQLLQARGARFAAAVVSGGLFYFTLGLTPSWLAAWLAPIPLLLAAFHASRREARLLAWLAAAIGLSSNFTYYLKTTGTVATVVLLLLQVLVWGFFVVRTRAAVVASRNCLARRFRALMRVDDVAEERGRSRVASGSPSHCRERRPTHLDRSRRR